MCIALYIASDLEVPMAAYNERIPKFYVSELDKKDLPVIQQFELSHVAFSTSNEGMG